MALLVPSLEHSLHKFAFSSFDVPTDCQVPNTLEIFGFPLPPANQLVIEMVLNAMMQTTDYQEYVKDSKVLRNVEPSDLPCTMLSSLSQSFTPSWRNICITRSEWNGIWPEIKPWFRWGGGGLSKTSSCCPPKTHHLQILDLSWSDDIFILLATEVPKEISIHPTQHIHPTFRSKAFLPPYMRDGKAFNCGHFGTNLSPVALFVPKLRSFSQWPPARKSPFFYATPI